MRARDALRLATLAIGACACSGEPKHEGAAPASEPVAQVAVPQPVVPPVPKPAEPAAVARVADVVGVVTLGSGGSALQKGDLLHAGDVLQTGADGKLVLDLENEARISLQSSATLMLVPEEHATVLLVAGTLQATQMASPQSQRAALRIATLDVSIEAERALDALVQTNGEAGTRVLVSSGTAEVTDLMRVPPSTMLEAHIAYASIGAKVKAIKAPDLAKEASSFSVSVEVPLTSAHGIERMITADAEFEATRKGFAEQRESMRAKQLEQRAAHEKHDLQAVHELQAAVVAQAQQGVTLRKHARAAYERRLALMMRMQVTEAEKKVAVDGAAKDYAALGR